MSTPDLVHYLGWPQLRDEPTLCGIPREYGHATTTIGANVTCPKCRKILELEDD